MVHVGMRDEDVAHPQKLAGRQTRDVADVKQDRPPLELQVDEYARVAERPVDERRVENGPHRAENTIRAQASSRGSLVHQEAHAWKPESVCAWRRRTDISA